MNIRSARLTIGDFTPDMAQALHRISMDEDVQRFVPDEVFPTVEAAAEVIEDLTAFYGTADGPLVHPVLLEGELIGYVQMVPLEEGWEIGYHISALHTGKGYATEAVRAFLPVMMDRLNLNEVAGVCLKANAASARVLRKCGFVLVFDGEADYQGRPAEVLKMVYRR